MDHSSKTHGTTLNRYDFGSSNERGINWMEKPKLLWLNCRLLHPLIGGDRLRTFHMLRNLKAYFAITYVCPIFTTDSQDSISSAESYCDTLIFYDHTIPSKGSREFNLAVLWNCLFGTLPYMARKYVSGELHKWLRKEVVGGDFDLIVCDYLVSYAHLLTLGEKLSTPTIVFQHNVESLIWLRHSVAASNIIKRWIYRRELKLTEKMEDQCGRNAQGQITVSPDETNYFRDRRGMNNVLGDVPTGVDADYFTPNQNFEPYTLAFLGSMDWEANAIAVRNFLEFNYPEIKLHFPSVRFIIIGRNPPTDLLATSLRDPTIEVTGTVSDVRPYLSSASIMVLPLTVGGGTRVKVFEAMAAGLAVVSTSIGVEGLPVENGKHALVAETGSPFTDAIISLLSNKSRRDKIAQTARTWVEQNASWKSSSSKFYDLCRPLIKV